MKKSVKKAILVKGFSVSCLIYKEKDFVCICNCFSKEIIQAYEKL